MRVVAQGEAEMAEILREVIGLLHRPQGRDVDQLGIVGPGRGVQQRVQVTGLQHLPLGERETRRAGGFAQVFQFVRIGLLVDPEQQRLAFLDQGLGGGDIGQDHQLFDQPMCIQTTAEIDRGHLATVVENDLALWQVQIQRLAGVAGGFQRLIGSIKRLDHLGEEGFGPVGDLAVHGGLDFLVAQRGLGFHQSAHEVMADLIARAVDLHPHGKTGARHAFVQRAQIARQPIRQHRHNPVGEIAGVAPFAGLAIQGSAGGHIGGDIGDGDPDHMAARVLGVLVGMGETGVVMVAGIRRVDGDKRQVAQILAAAQAHRFGAVGLGDDLVGEMIGDAVLIDRDQRHRLGRRRIAEPFDDPRFGQTHPRLGAGLFRLDQFTVLGAMSVRLGHRPFVGAGLVDGNDASALGSLAIDAENAFGIGADATDQPRLVVVVLFLHHGQAGQDTVAFSQRRIRGAKHHQHGGFDALAMPFQRVCIKIAIVVRRLDLKDRDRRQAVGVCVAALALFQMPFGFQLLQHALEVDPLSTFDAKSLGNVSFRSLGRVGGDPFQNLGLCGDARHIFALAWRSGDVMPKRAPPRARQRRDGAGIRSERLTLCFACETMGQGG
ncbi:hypothetical protein TRIHO_19080 [Tritonibacter horizontis]|uniref:Uncharacterized protein n=1 Tax=Tritonibacter horizontis TaxID=1768241 RepID=A0A132BYY1_9RHOB|nr:hypothetical protein TRIHO_19080 [Tritonibacter horizontis]